MTLLICIHLDVGHSMRHRANAMFFRLASCLSWAALLTAFTTPACARLLTSSNLSRLRSMDLSAEKSVRFGGDKPGDGPLWSADSRWIAFRGADGDRRGLRIAHPDGSDAAFLAALAGTTSPLRLILVLRNALLSEVRSVSYARAADFTVPPTVDGTDDVPYEQRFSSGVTGELKPTPQLRANRRFEEAGDKK
ncbi:MAG: hypothetical protein WB762_20980 [Candidatus Sulfotelmatobacter sp.]